MEPTGISDTGNRNPDEQVHSMWEYMFLFGTTVHTAVLLRATGARAQHLDAARNIPQLSRLNSSAMYGKRGEG